MYSVHLLPFPSGRQCGVVLLDHIADHGVDVLLWRDTEGVARELARAPPEGLQRCRETALGGPNPNALVVVDTAHVHPWSAFGEAQLLWGTVCVADIARRAQPLGHFGNWCAGDVLVKPHVLRLLKCALSTLCFP